MANLRLVGPEAPRRSIGSPRERSRGSVRRTGPRVPVNSLNRFAPPVSQCLMHIAVLFRRSFFFSKSNKREPRAPRSFPLSTLRSHYLRLKSYLMSLRFYARILSPFLLDLSALGDRPNQTHKHRAAGALRERYIDASGTWGPRSLRLNAPLHPLRPLRNPRPAPCRCEICLLPVARSG